jgi:cell division protein FtsN
MIELAHNIEFLLLENDCVIVPGLGGFIAHYQPAHYEAAEHRFYPPVRNIGFNPQLIMNDGLLAQLYMQKHHTDFPDATYRIQHAVEALKDVLFDEGRVQIPGVGELCFNMRHAYEFHPMTEGQKSPALYGLGAFTLQPLSQKFRPEVFPAPGLAEEQGRQRRILSGRRWASHLAAAVVAVMLFFALSSPVENTYVDNGNYASLGTDGLFDAIRSQSLLANVLNPTSDQDKKVNQATKQNNKTDKKDKTSSSKKDKTNSSKKQDTTPVKVGEEKVPAKNETPAKNGSAQNGSMQNDPTQNQPTQNQPTQQNKPQQTAQQPVQNAQQYPAVSTSSSNSLYYLIVSSLATLADAQKELSNFVNKGFTNATIVEGNGRYRISLGGYSDMNTANSKLKELKKDNAYQNAWLLRK